MKQLPESLFFEKGSRAVLLLHAYTGSFNDVRMLARFLEKNQYTVYAPLFSGHGTKSPEDILQQTPEQWWQDAQSALSFLKAKGYKEIAVFGLSMGGIYAAHILTLADEAVIGGGTFCSPLAKRENTVHQNFMLYAKQVLKDAWDVTKEQEIADDSIEQLAKIEAFADIVYQKLPMIMQPFFLAQAGKDALINPQVAFDAAQKLQQTRLTLQWYPESGHVITVGVNRKELEKDVLHFIEELSWNEENK